MALRRCMARRWATGRSPVWKSPMPTASFARSSSKAFGDRRRARIDQDQLGDLLRRCLREIAGSPVSPVPWPSRVIVGACKVRMFDGGRQSRLHALGVAGPRRILLGCGRVRLVTVRRGCLFADSQPNRAAQQAVRSRCRCPRWAYRPQPMARVAAGAGRDSAPDRRASG